jgi:hypothetical protein
LSIGPPWYSPSTATHVPRIVVLSSADESLFEVAEDELALDDCGEDDDEELLEGQPDCPSTRIRGTTIER